MTEPETCPYADNEDIDHRYLAGTLPDSEAEEFERHYFECDLCWDRVRRGAEIGASLPQTKSVGQTHSLSRSARRSFILWGTPLAAAAAGLVIAIGLWRSRVDRPAEEPTPPVSPSVEPIRGSGTPFTVSSNTTNGVIVAAWSRPSQAKSYRVRLLAADGTLLFERETADTSMVIPSDSARISAQSATPYWEVQALDELRKIVATSRLTPARAARDSS